MRPNKTLHTNRRPALGFGLSAGLFGTGRPHHVILRAAVGELGRSAASIALASCKPSQANKRQQEKTKTMKNGSVAESVGENREKDRETSTAERRELGLESRRSARFNSLLGVSGLPETMNGQGLEALSLLGKEKVAGHC